MGFKQSAASAFLGQVNAPQYPQINLVLNLFAGVYPALRILYCLLFVLCLYLHLFGAVLGHGFSFLEGLIVLGHVRICWLLLGLRRDEPAPGALGRASDSIVALPSISLLSPELISF